MGALDATQLASVAALWRSAGRELVTSFQGVSMLPTVAPGQRVLLRCGADVKPGDIVAVLRGADVLVHRLVDASPSRGWWLLKGDANRFCDPPVTNADAILGRIEQVERDGAFVAPPPPAGETKGRLLAAASVSLLRRSPRAGILVLGAVTKARRRLLAAVARLRAGAGGASPPATPS